jgi:Holliday junction resolvase-like predicted endonuclease
MSLGRKGEVGRLGEDIAARFLVKHGFRVVARNWRSGQLEIDLIVRNDRGIRFVEVKSGEVPRGTFGPEHGTSGRYRPEWHVGPWKQQTFRNAVRSYRSLQSDDEEFHVDVIAVEVCREIRECKVRWIRNVLLEGSGE